MCEWEKESDTDHSWSISLFHSHMTQQRRQIPQKHGGGFVRPESGGNTFVDTFSPPPTPTQQTNSAYVTAYSILCLLAGVCLGKLSLKEKKSLVCMWENLHQYLYVKVHKFPSHNTLHSTIHRNVNSQWGIVSGGKLCMTRTCLPENCGKIYSLSAPLLHYLLNINFF